MRFDTLLEKLEDRLSPADKHRLERAYRYAEAGHAGQLRADGSPYIGHPVAVADILVDLGLPIEALEAALLHDVVEDNDDIELSDIEKEFGPDVARLVNGVTKLTELPRVSRAGELDEGDEPLTSADRARIRQAETIRKTILAMNDDVRVVLIKLADRLHNMRTLGNLRPDKQQRIADETLQVFAPLANRLGIWRIKWELEDLSLRYLDPERYRSIAAGLAQRRSDREAVMQQIVDRLRTELAKHGVEGDISGRPKHIYSIYKKMDRKNASLNEINDIRAVRVIVPSESACYTALGVVHSLWRPVPGEFDDYIAAPKDNFYQSLHTAVIYEDGQTLEIQIRTPEMHKHAEYGIAAHWRYKEGTQQRDEKFEKRVAYLRNMIDWQSEVTEGEAFVEALKEDVFEDRVYVFTPRGDVVDLPTGATPIDFAYHIHTDVGHRCRGAKVNGALVSLSTPLKNGDKVEILPTKRGGPSRDWLNADLGYVKSTRAREKIRNYFRRLDRDIHITEGRGLLERELKRLSIHRWSHEDIAAMYGFTRTEEFMAAVGRGDISTASIINRLVRRLREESPEENETLPPPATRGQTSVSQMTPLPPAVESDQVKIHGVGGLLTHIARCCNPLPGDPIIGFTTRGRGVTIHRRDCPNMLRHPEPQRLISVSWGGMVQQRTYHVPIRIEAFDRDGLLRDITQIVANEKINMSAVNVPPIRSHRVYVSATLDVEDLSQLLKIMNRIEQLQNIISVQRMSG